MTRHLLGIGCTSLAIVVAGMSLTAQQSRAVARPAQEQGRGVTMRPAQGRGMIGADESGPRPQAFSVVLVLGEMQASGGSDTVPPAARKALTDVKDFLPYKAYRLLDAQWTLCCGLSMVTRLRGPEDQDYSLELSPRNLGSGKWSVRFSLWEPRPMAETALTAGPSPVSEAQRTTFEAQRAALQQRLAELQKSATDNHPDIVRLRTEMQELERTLAARRDESARRTFAAVGRRPVIDTSFTMDIGETVVVGTSRLKGDKALIALLTAVAPTRSPAR